MTSRDFPIHQSYTSIYIIKTPCLTRTAQWLRATRVHRAPPIPISPLVSIFNQSRFFRSRKIEFSCAHCVCIALQEGRERELQDSLCTDAPDGSRTPLPDRRRVAEMMRPLLLACATICRFARALNCPRYIRASDSRVYTVNVERVLFAPFFCRPFRQ